MDWRGASRIGLRSTALAPCSCAPAVSARHALEGRPRLALGVRDVRPHRVEPAATVGKGRAHEEENALHRELGVPARGGERLEADGAADRHVAGVELEARRDDAHKRRRGRVVAREGDLELDRLRLAGPAGVVDELARESVPGSGCIATRHT